MVKKLTFKDYLMIVPALLFIGLIILTPSVSAQGAKYGLYVSATVLIPSLFPFAIPVLFLINTGLFSSSKRPFLYLYFLSLIGGYPIGAKLISELYEKGIIELPNAKKYLPLCVNAGPAFIVIAVGKGILHSATLGYVLLFSHTVASVILMSLFAPDIVKKTENKATIITEISAVDNFVTSIKKAAETSVIISVFVVFFSVVNNYIDYFSEKISALKKLLYFTEVTYSVSHTENVYFIAFLLGFAGISIWVQVFSVARKIKPNFSVFATFRILHGILASTASALIIKVLKINISVISNNVVINEKGLYSGLTLNISLLIMLLLFLISITSKKRSGNFIKDVI